MTNLKAALPISASQNFGNSTYQMEVNGSQLPYVDDGQGETVLFLHGAVTDHRKWNRHRAIMADKYRTVAYTQRYFGTLPWESGWPPFGIDTHSNDLVEFLQKLGVGPVHLVACSYSGHIALNVALKHPQLFQSIFIHEPVVPTYVRDRAELETIRADVKRMYDPILAAVHDECSNVEVLRRLLDGTGQRLGYFDTQPQERQELWMDSARTIPLLLAQSVPPLITCKQLRTLTLPICIAQGELTRPVFSIISRAAARCIPTCKYTIVPGAIHMWSDEDAESFAEAVLNFLFSLKT